MHSLTAVIVGAGKITLGLAIARALGILSMPLIARIYDADDFAVMALYVSVLSLLRPVASLRYPAGIPLPRTNTLALNLAAASLTIIVIFTCIISLAATTLIIASPEIAAVQLLSGYLWLVPIGVFCSALYDLAIFWSTREQSFTVIAYSKISQAFSGNFAKVTLGLIGVQPAGLLIGQVFSQSGGLIIQIRAAYPRIRLLPRSVKLRHIKKALRQYWQFPVYQLPSQLFAIGAEHAPIVYIASNYPSSQAGNYGLAMTVVALPVSLAAKSVSNALYASLAKLGKRRASDVRRVTIRLLACILVLVAPAALLIMLYSGSLVPLVLGEEWQLAGTIVGIMVPFMIGNIVFTTVSRVLSVFHQQSLKLRLDIQRFAIVLSVLIVASSYDAGLLPLAKAYSALLFIHFVLSTAWILCFLKKLTFEPSLQKTT